MPTAEQQAEIQKRLKAGNPIYWLKAMIDKAKLPADVRAHVNELFKQHKTYLNIDPDVAYEAALKIAARVNWVRSQYALLMNDPSDRKHLALSKVTSQWVVNLAKYNKTQPVGRTPGNGKQVFPSTSENTEVDSIYAESD